MTDFDIQLWAAINAYAEACGGDTSAKTNSGKRMDCVARVEEVLREAGWQPMSKPPTDILNLRQGRHAHRVEVIMEVSAWEVIIHPARYKGWREIPKD